jgi:hypothetical protein
MKTKLNVLTAVLFAATLFLNLSTDSKGHFAFFAKATAKKTGGDYKGPSNWYCYNDGTNTLNCTKIVCTDEGSVACNPTTPCPAGTHP